ncbi:hypothetical protein PIB30_091000 [Stylosanthes scabra]|uniref:Putative plant transposon protein domain-containing protein n=1 Tax=Stylosanthes scabra TaxID=79078 RepID=A0ABU6UVJ5_9FABA|nr:hypothetical protein [Stylosanthes scabra]
MASKGKAPARAPSTRARGSTSQQQPPLEVQLYETSRMLKGQRALKIEKSFMSAPLNFLKEWTRSRNGYWQEDGTLSMNQVSISIYHGCRSFMRTELRRTSVSSKEDVGTRISLVNMDDVLKVIGKGGATWWEDPRTPVIPARPKRKILNNEAWMWMKLIICNITPTRHETTLHMETVLLIYALMMDMPVSLPSVMNFMMNADPTKAKNLLLPYPMFITKWGQEANVPRLPGDMILKIPKSRQFFPFGKWREEDEEVAHPVPPPMPSPVPPPAAPTNIPAPSAPSSPEPSRRDFMRALRRNECIMRRYEQLMLMLHPGLDTSGLEQISSPEISQNQQEEGARSIGRAGAEEEEDF